MNGPVDSPTVRAANRPMRLVRTVAAALVCTVTAALGHLAGGGVIPTEVALLAFVGSALVAWSLCARRVTTGQLVGLLVLCQICVHFASTSMNMSVLMMSTHVAATVVSAVALTRGEAFVWQLAERLGLRAVLALARIRLVPTTRPLGFAPRLRSRINVFLAHSRIERGPPIAS